MFFLCFVRFLKMVYTHDSYSRHFSFYEKHDFPVRLIWHVRCNFSLATFIAHLIICFCCGCLSLICTVNSCVFTLILIFFCVNKNKELVARWNTEFAGRTDVIDVVQYAQVICGCRMDDQVQTQGLRSNYFHTLPSIWSLNLILFGWCDQRTRRISLGITRGQCEWVETAN